MTTEGAHPCFSCALPDCDESDSRCSLHRAISRYRYHQRRKEEIPAEARNAKNIAYQELYGHLRERDTRRNHNSPRNRENRNEQ